MKKQIIKLFKEIAIYKYFIIVSIALILLISAFVLDYHEKDAEVPIAESASSMTNTTTFKGFSLNENCSNCHNENITRSGVNIGKCNACHGNSHGVQGTPGRYKDTGKKTIHLEHSIPIATQKSCTRCHSPPSCNKCHSGHNGIPDINISNNCQECHGDLPEPRGHRETRVLLTKSRHSWMDSCSTCHRGSELKFKDMAVYSRSNSSLLCSNCHSKQYKDAQHYEVNRGFEKKKCVDCHNPHSLMESRFSLEVPVSIEKVTDDAGEYIKNNLAFVIIIFLLIGSVILEYALGPKKGNVVLSKVLKVEHEKSKARAIRISLTQSLSPSAAGSIANVLERNNINLIGMSAANNEVVLFISKEKVDYGNDIILEIKAIQGISEAEYSNDYEIQ